MHNKIILFFILFSSLTLYSMEVDTPREYELRIKKIEVKQCLLRHCPVDFHLLLDIIAFEELTPLFKEVIESGIYDICLKKHKFDYISRPDVRDDLYPRTSLMSEAIHYGNLEIILYLVRKGVSLNTFIDTKSYFQLLIDKLIYCNAKEQKEYYNFLELLLKEKGCPGYLLGYLIEHRFPSAHKLTPENIESDKEDFEKLVKAFLIYGNTTSLIGNIGDHSIIEALKVRGLDNIIDLIMTYKDLPKLNDA